MIHLSQRELQHNPVVGRLAQAIRLSEVLHELGDRLAPGLGVKAAAVTVQVDRARPGRREQAAARELGRGR